MSDTDPGIEGRIRAGLRTQVAEIDPSIDDSWSEIRRRADAPVNGSRRGFAFAAVAALVVVVVLATIVIARRSSTDVATIPEPGPGSASPLVALDGAGNVVELRADGTVTREIAKGPFRGQLSVSPTDRTIYAERFVPGDWCSMAYVSADDLVGEIVAVPWTGGSPTIVVGHGTAPAISPDGRRLAYLAGADDCHVPPATRSLHVMDLADGAISEHRGVRVVVTGIGPPGWAAPEVLVGLYTRDHSCPSGSARSACTTPYLQAYDLGVLDASEGRGPSGSSTSPSDPPSSADTPYIGDLTEVGATESVVGAGGGALVTAGVTDDGRTIVIGRVVLDGAFGDYVESTRVDTAPLGLPSTVQVSVSTDPASEQLAVTATLAGGGTALLVGPASNLRLVSQSVSSAAWSPAR